MKNIISKPNDVIVIVVKKLSLENNCFVLLPQEVSLGKIDENNIFTSEDGRLVLFPILDNDSLLSKDEMFYAYPIKLADMRTQNLQISNETMLMIEYYEEIASYLNLVVMGSMEIKSYRLPYKLFDKRITGTIMKDLIPIDAKNKTHKNGKLLEFKQKK